jgi:hypothetical protein
MTITEDGGQIRIPADSIAILDLLLRAAFCTPRMWDDTLASLPDVERAESRDALMQNSLPLPQLTWEWGTSVGEMNPLATGTQEVDMSGFYDALEGLAEVFALQISVPIIGEAHDHVDSMPPFAGQRLHLVNRGDWMSFGPPPEDLGDEELDEAAIPEDIPIFTDPAIRIGERRAGEVWVRLDPEVAAEMRKTPEDLFALLLWTADNRVRQFRETIRRRQQELSPDDVSRIAAIVERVSSWERFLHRVAKIIESLPAEQREAKLPGVLDLATGHWQPLTVFVSYSHDSESHKQWVASLADRLEKLSDFQLIFDSYDLHAGKDLTYFMERVAGCDKVIVIVTPEYVRKATARVGGVGYEGSVISASLFHDCLTDRFVPVLREGVELPPFLRTKIYVDFRDDGHFESALNELTAALRGKTTLLRPSKGA